MNLRCFGQKLFRSDACYTYSGLGRAGHDFGAGTRLWGSYRCQAPGQNVLAATSAIARRVAQKIISNSIMRAFASGTFVLGHSQRRYHLAQAIPGAAVWAATRPLSCPEVATNAFSGGGLEIANMAASCLMHRGQIWFADSGRARREQKSRPCPWSANRGGAKRADKKRSPDHHPLVA